MMRKLTERWSKWTHEDFTHHLKSCQDWCPLHVNVAETDFLWRFQKAKFPLRYLQHFKTIPQIDAFSKKLRFHELWVALLNLHLATSYTELFYNRSPEVFTCLSRNVDRFICLYEYHWSNNFKWDAPHFNWGEVLTLYFHFKHLRCSAFHERNLSSHKNKRETSKPYNHHLNVKSIKRMQNILEQYWVLWWPGTAIQSVLWYCMIELKVFSDFMQNYPSKCEVLTLNWEQMWKSWLDVCVNKVVFASLDIRLTVMTRTSSGCIRLAQNWASDPISITAGTATMYCLHTHTHVNPVTPMEPGRTCSFCNNGSTSFFASLLLFTMSVQWNPINFFVLCCISWICFWTMQAGKSLMHT